MVARPKHPAKELEQVLGEAERQGWTVTKGKKYYMMRCGCGSHQKTVRLTPSDPSYRRNLLGWLKRSGCWKGTDR